MEEKIRVLVVDDAAFMRKAVSDILDSDSRIQAIDSARNGLEALEKIKELRPDIVTLDIDMPVMDGLTSIRHIMIESPVPVVVLSSFFADGAITFEALRLGVMDFVPKPSGAVSSDIERSKRHIIDRVKVAHSAKLENVHRVRLTRKWNRKEQLADLYRFRPLTYVIAVGTNLSGPNTVIRLLSRLSPTLPAAVIVVQELSPKIISAFVKEFDEYVPWKVEAAEDGAIVEQGTCYICSNETSLSLKLNAEGKACLKSGDRIDYPLDLLFSSAAEVFQQNTIGLLLTGTGDDGTQGFARIKGALGVTMAQDARCCVYPNLTDQAIRHGVVDVVVDETKLHGAIEALIGQ